MHATSDLQLSLRPPPRVRQPPPGLAPRPQDLLPSPAPPSALTEYLSRIPTLTLTLLPATGILCCMLACWQGYNSGRGRVPHLFQCLNCLRLFVRGRVATSSYRGSWGQNEVTYSGGADFICIIPAGDSGRGCPLAIVQPTVVVPTRGICYALSSKFQGSTHPVRTLTPRKEGASLDLLNSFNVMPNIDHPNFQELWTAMTKSSAVDSTFPLANFSKWLARTVPEGEPPLSSRFNFQPLLPYQRSGQTAFCEHWSAIVDAGDAPA